MSDNEIIELIKSENSESINKAFRHLYKDSYSSVKRLISANSGNEDDVADVFQEALIIFFIKVKKNQFELRSNIQAYLYGTSRNLWMKKIRENRTNLSELHIEESYNFDEESIIQNNQTTVREVLGNIGTTCKSVLLDFYFKKLSMKDIAVLYDLGSEEAAKNKKYRCLKKLIEYINKKKLSLSDFTHD